MKTTKFFIHRATMTLLAMLLTVTTAWAETETVNYIDAAGNTQSVTATVLTSGVTTIPAGWCVVKDYTFFNQPIQLMGDVNLILADGATMTMGSNENRVGAHAIYGGRGSLVASGGTDYGLRIYGQSGQSGVLDIWGTTNSTSYACIKVRDLFVYGGNISLRGCNGISTRGQFDGYVNLYRGTVNITTSKNTGKGINSYYFRMFGGALNINGLGEKAIYSNKFSMSSGTLSVYDSGNIANSDDASSTFEMTGGQLYVNGTKKGIYANTVTLGLTQDNDLIEANNYFGSNVQVATGKVMMDATNPESPIYYMGTLDVDQKAAIAGKVIKAARFKGTGAVDDPYMIYTAAGWNTFCEMLASDDVAKYDFSGKYVKLGNDINVTTMAGTGTHPFSGNFDGDGHTLTVNYSITEQDYAAPFRYVQGATIQNLNVEGSINASSYRAGGIVGHTYSHPNTITNCRVSATITGGDYTGGISSGGYVEVNHCVFNGIITRNTVNDKIGGLVGQNNSTTGQTVSYLSIINSLFDPQDGSTCSNALYVPYGQINPTISNSYYTSLAGGTAQGNQAHTITADAMANMTLTGSVGVQFGSTGYAKCGERVGQEVIVTPETVSLTLADPGTAPTGYTTTDYFATAGNLNGSGTSYTLEMPTTNTDVEISAFTPTNYDITYNLNGGDLAEGYPATYTIQSDDVILPTPTKDGSRFLGWFDNSGLTGSPVTTIPHGSTGAKEFWAKWEAIVNPTNKDLGMCTAMVPNQELSAYSTTNNYTMEWNNISYKFEAANDPASNGFSVGEEVKDGETVLTLGTDYKFGSVEYLSGDGSKPGDECSVEIVGQGGYDGSIWVDFTIIGPEVSNQTWGDLTWSLSNGELSISLTNPANGNKPMPETTREGYPWYPFGSYITSITINEDNETGYGITTIAASAFASTSNVSTYGNVTTVSLPSTLTGSYDDQNNLLAPAIGDYAFSFCTGAAITIPTNTTTFGSAPFNQVGYYDADADEIKGGVTATLSDTGDNSALIGALSSARFANVTINRTLYKDGNWNTLCLPFDMTNAQVTALAPNGLMELDVDNYYDANNIPYDKRDDGKYYNGSTEYTGTAPLHQTGFADGTLYLYFKDATSITAGKPYIIKWAKDEGYDANPSNFDLANPTFYNVSVIETMNNVTSKDTYVTFLGTYSPVTYAGENKSILFLGGNSNLFYPNGTIATNINAFRAYFQLNNGLKVGTPAGVKEFKLNFDGCEDSADGIGDAVHLNDRGQMINDNAIYNLAGQRLSKMQRGINIVNGKKVVVK